VTIQESKRPSGDLFTDSWNFMQDSWENFIIQNNLMVAIGSDALFDFFCKMFCESMRYQLQAFIRNYTAEIQRRRRTRQSPS
jgi:hypothetical protein